MKRIMLFALLVTLINPTINAWGGGLIKSLLGGSEKTSPEVQHEEKENPSFPPTIPPTAPSSTPSIGQEQPKSEASSTTSLGTQLLPPSSESSTPSITITGPSQSIASPASTPPTHSVEMTAPKSTEPTISLEPISLYTSIDWNPDQIWETISEATLPDQVYYWNKVNYQKITKKIELLSKDSITPENKMKYEGKVSDAIRDTIGNMSSTLQSYPNSKELVAMLFPDIKCLAQLANKSNKLGIINKEKGKLVAAWLKKYITLVEQLKEKSAWEINAYEEEITTIITMLGFNNDIHRALDSLNHLDPKVVESKRTELENQVASMLSLLIVKSNSSSIEEATMYMNYADQIITKSEELKIAITQHHLTAVNNHIKEIDAQIDHALAEKTKTLLTLRKNNKKVRKKIHEVKTTTYKTNEEEKLSDNEYEKIEDAVYMFNKVPQKSDQN